MGDAVGKGVGLAGPSTRNDQKRAPNMTIRVDAMLNGPTLLWIKRFEI
jgi:hypothetical protein